MAYTKTPQGDTYQSKDISFVYRWDDRSSFTNDAPGNLPYDAVSQNIVFEPVSSQITGEKIYNAYKRDGSSHLTWGASGAPPTLNTAFNNPVVGIWYSSPSEKLIVVTWNGALSSSWYVLGHPGILPGDMALNATGNFGGFVNNNINWTDFVFDNGDIAVFFAHPNSGNSIERLMPLLGTQTTLNTGPVGDHNSDPTTLDGYVFLSTPDGRIWNSNLNDPTTWGASNFITAESYGDALVRIARSSSYIVAFGTDSIEWFYDAANPTGSPLSVYTGATQRVGFLGGLAAVGDTLYFVGKATNQSTSLYKITGLKLERIADFTINRKLQGNFATSFEFATGNFIILNGHTVYVWWSASNDSFPICYDLDTGLFISVDFKQGDYDLIQTTAVPFSASQYSSLFCRTGDNLVYYYDATVYRDDGVDFTCFLQTKNNDFDTRRLKFGSRVLLSCDQTDSTSNCQLSWTVDDYKTWSAVRNIDLENVYPATFALGQFRKIAFKLEYTDNFPMRFSALELDYNQGGQ